MEVGSQAALGKLPPNYPKMTQTEPVAITKDNVGKYIRPNAVF